MNIVLGIIVDTFSELREHASNKSFVFYYPLICKEYDVQHYCYICHKTNIEFEKSGTDWFYHRKYHHNLWSYVDYLVQL